jgi:hypothetical protein
MNRLVRRVLGEAADNIAEPLAAKMDDPAQLSPHGPARTRDFILNNPRPEIEARYERVFATILGLTSARCSSRNEGPILKLKIRFNRAQRPGMNLGHLHYILRDLPKEFDRRLVSKSTLMCSIGDAATLTFALESAK